MAGILNPIEGVTYCGPELAAEYFRGGAWIDLTVGEALRETARKLPSRPAFISDERSLTFEELDSVTERLGAALLDAGLATGDRALFQMGTTIDTVVALLACYKIGVVPVCTIPQYREIEIGHLSRQSGAKGYFVQADFSAFDLVAFAKQTMERHATLKHLVVARSASDPGAHRQEALIGKTGLEYARSRLREIRIGSGDVLKFQLSGGTTGVPKIIPRFHAEYLGQSHAYTTKRLGMSSSSTVIWALPLLHNAGQLFSVIPVVLYGVTAVLMPKVDVRRMLELIEEHRVTHAMSIGPIAPQIIAYKDLGRHDLSSLRLFATMSRADSLEQHIGVPCANLFGITEGLLMMTPPEGPAKARHYTQGASGCPYDEIRLLRPESEEPVKPGEMGELCFRGPSSLRGYFNAPDSGVSLFTADGFFRSGDMMIAHVVEGVTYYAFQGRLRDNVNRGGEKIGCEEVEAFVSMHPAVADAKLVAMPDPIYGEKACVYLVLRPGHGAPEVKELADFLAGKGLAKFKCPERIELIDAFPLTRVGKVDKLAMRVMIAEKLARESAGAATTK